MRLAGILLISAFLVSAADKASFETLKGLADKPDSPEFRAALTATLDPADMEDGTAWIGHGPDVLWAVQAPARPHLLVDSKPGPAMRPITGTKIWFAVGRVAPLGTMHWFEYVVNGEKYGGNPWPGTGDATRMKEFPAFTPDSYAQPGVPQGKLSEKLTFTSKVYDGMTNDYYVYVPAEYDPKTPAALMVWQDGTRYINRDSAYIRTLDVIDNLIYQKKIPVMISVFINPGTLENNGSELYKKLTERRGGRGGGAGASGAPGAGRGRGAAAASGQPAPRPAFFPESTPRVGGRGGAPGGPIDLRSFQYDTVDDRYSRYLEEFLPEIEKKYNIRKDSYSRAITGLSSGAICALNVAWQRPDMFSRVITWIGSFTGIQWRLNEQDGGNAFPNIIRSGQKKNFRVWIQDGRNDVENNQGSWPLQAIEMANSFKLRQYDFHLSFGYNTHNPSQGSAEFPAEMIWLWRDYDPARTEQIYAMDEKEKSLPMYRIATLNRE